MVLKEIKHRGSSLLRDVAFIHEHRVVNVDAPNLAKVASSLALYLAVEFARHCLYPYECYE
jgi:hypothetical protein